VTDLTCILCEADAMAEVVSYEVRDDRSGLFKVVRCLTCGHIQLFPLPSEEENEKFYLIDEQARSQAGEYDFYLWKKKTDVDTKRHVDWVRSIKSEGNVLDIGSGFGFFVDSLARFGYQVMGIDVGDERLSSARSNLKGKFLRSEVSENFVNQYSNRFEIVTLFHVLEHVLKPVEFLRYCFRVVAPGGYLLIEVPNVGDALLETCEPYRNFYWQRAHLNYFDLAHLELAFRRANFTNFSINGVQRYGLRNLLHWIDYGEPQVNDPSFYATDPALAELEIMYRRDRERCMSCDTLTAQIRK
jgi:2-polyprenyl-3-methyl-5-hydroxy-6-metoxy-1,4-benzoquinol methylase